MGGARETDTDGTALVGTGTGCTGGTGMADSGTGTALPANTHQNLVGQEFLAN